MFLKRISMLCIALLCSIVAYFMLFLKDVVLKLNIELDMINEQIVNEKNAINILKSELAYLSSPPRLRFLSDKHLKLQRAELNQIDNGLFEKNQPIALNNNIKVGVKNMKKIKWRKKGKFNQYLATASHKERK